MRLSEVTRRLVARAQRGAHSARFRRSLRHVAGPLDMPGDGQDVVLITPIRDGAYYLDGFLDHHRALGVRHFLFCDNGSCDDTVARLKTEPDVTVFECLLPVLEVENDIRRSLAETYCRDRWVLYADADELFDFAGSDRLGLRGLTRYLIQHGFTAMVAQMVEMFPKTPLAADAATPFAEAIERFRYYDLSDAAAVPYHDPSIDFSQLLADNTVPSDTVCFYFGGVRKRVFGEACCLTKHPLVHVRAGVRPGVHPHCASGVACADVTGMIRHYKFTNDPFGRDAQAVATGNMAHGEDALRLSAVSNMPDLTLWSETAQRLTSIDMLYNQRFLVQSSQYQRAAGT